MKEILKATGSILLGLVVVAAVLFVFSPIGEFLCGPSMCFDEGQELPTNRPWALFGFLGFFGVFIGLVVLALLFGLGEWTKGAAEDVKHEIGTWYGRRLLAKREAEALEDNGGPSMYDESE